MTLDLAHRDVTSRAPLDIDDAGARRPPGLAAVGDILSEALNDMAVSPSTVWTAEFPCFANVLTSCDSRRIKTGRKQKIISSQEILDELLFSLAWLRGNSRSSLFAFLSRIALISLPPGISFLSLVSLLSWVSLIPLCSSFSLLSFRSRVTFVTLLPTISFFSPFTLFPGISLIPFASVLPSLPYLPYPLFRLFLPGRLSRPFPLADQAAV